MGIDWTLANTRRPERITVHGVKGWSFQVLRSL